MIITEVELQDDDFIAIVTEDSESDDEAYDDFCSVCAICDNGGELICCEGKCFRSFHATKESAGAQDSNCDSLCLSTDPEALKFNFVSIIVFVVVILGFTAIMIITEVELQDDDFIAIVTEDSESDDEAYDDFCSVCAICENGGELICCEGKCFRSFHATKESAGAQDSNCDSLCLSPDPEALKEHYICENCRYNLHQCFVCGELGSSDKSSNTEVFQCSAATCGHFYHPKCVAKLLQKDNEAEPQVLEIKIAGGYPFICPAHKCAVCKQIENENVEDFQFAVCCRCPTSYHRKCLPRNIKFDDEGDNDAITRAWNGLLPKSRALMYCNAATCGHFYHPKCVAKLLQKDNEAEPQVLERKIAGGYPFICPAHKCAVCKQIENENVEDFQFAVCCRCPTSYHRKCLPRNIKFDDEGDNDAVTRAWNGLLPKSRALMYCKKHEIINGLGTPARRVMVQAILSAGRVGGEMNSSYIDPPHASFNTINSNYF
ncbi:zinc finger, PHD-type [Artemisia annua]|uniref:Zinc finger, PHD-type n=1 Tax=Artemisia annua TaxID=35608 RepID=A0A2U1NFV1_ARTAN|nr:zinc finger, PHD-type [Artemisia annua]